MNVYIVQCTGADQTNFQGWAHNFAYVSAQKKFGDHGPPLTNHWAPVGVLQAPLLNPFF